MNKFIIYRCGDDLLSNLHYEQYDCGTEDSSQYVAQQASTPRPDFEVEGEVMELLVFVILLGLAFGTSIYAKRKGAEAMVMVCFHSAALAQRGEERFEDASTKGNGEGSASTDNF